MKSPSFLDQEEFELLNAPFVNELFQEIDKTLSEPLFTISDFDLNARDASYWDDKGILPHHCGKGKRRKYNLVQGTWIKLIQQLRELGVPTDAIKKLKEKLLEEQATLNDVLKNPKAREVLELQLRKIGQLEAFLEAEKNEERMKNADKPIMSLFEMMVKYCVVLRKPFALMVFPDGSYLPNSLKILSELNDQYENVDEILNTPHTVVSISKSYQSLVVGWREKTFFSEIGIVTKQEKEILEALKQPNLISIEVIFKDEKIDLLKVCQKQKITPAHRLSDIIAKNGYHNIVIHTANGKPVHFENKILKKLRH